MDVDTGTDDAMALICALMSQELDIIGVCTVNGNREVKLTTENTLRVLQLLNSHAPVYKGCEYPIVATLDPARRLGIPKRENKNEDPNARHIHGDYLALPPSTWCKAQDLNAVTYYVQTLRNTKEKITLLPIGPLTNLALAMRCDERICENIEEIVFMGGTFREYDADTGLCEWNVWIDPESVEIVMSYAARHNIKVTWVPLDATHKVAMSADHAKQMRQIGSPAANAMASFIEKRIGGYSNDTQMQKSASAPVHDVLAVIALTHPEVLQNVTPVHVQVGCGRGICDGMTYLDMRQTEGKPAPNCHFAMGADKDLFCNTVMDILKNNTVYSK